MAQVRRPVPFRTRKLRPGTAMVLHPRGCGRVARRRFHTIRFPPVEPPRAPGGFLVFPPTAPHPVIPAFISPHIHIHLYIFIHSLPIRPSVLRGAPPARARRRRGTGPGGHGGLRGGPCTPPHGPRREVPDPHRGRGAPAGRPAAPGRAAENGAIRFDGGADGQGNREGHRASSLVYIGEDGGGLSVEVCSKRNPLDGVKAVSLILGHMAYVIRNGRNDASLLNYDIELLAIYDVLLALVTVV